MKNFRNFTFTIVGIFVLFACIFTACSQDSTCEGVIEKSTVSDLEKKIQHLSENYGFSINDIKSEDSVLVAEDDIMFNVNDFWDKYSLPSYTRAHYRSTNTVSSNYRTIRITTPSYGDPNEVPTEWLYAIVNAMDAWNSLNGDIEFTLGNNYTATILIVYGYISGDTVVARASFPSSTTGKPGSAIAINSDCVYTLTANQKTQVMIHELGHCIGFMHTDVVGDVLLNSGDQNTTDPNSVMQRYVLSNPTSPYFSQYDIAAYNLLYP